MDRIAKNEPRATFGVIGAGALIGFTLLAVLIGHEPRAGTTAAPAAQPGAVPVASVALHVEDGADGSVALRDAADDRLVAMIQPGQDGFIRGTLRGLAQARQREGLGRAAPFRLTRYDDGTLALDDEATGRRVALEAFGHTNALAFARLLPAQSRTQ